MVTLADDTGLYNRNLLRQQNLSVLTEKVGDICEVLDVLTQ